MSAALLRSAELISSFSDAARRLVSALSTECLNCEMVVAITSLRCSRARLASVCVCARRSRSIMVSRNTITVRAISPISSRGVRRRDSRRGVAVGETLHDRGKAVERPGDAAADQPAESRAPRRDHGDADHDDAGARARLRFLQPPRRVVGGVARILDDFIRARQHMLAVDVDDRADGADAAVAFDPILKRIGVGFHLPFESTTSSGACRRRGQRRR